MAGGLIAGTTALRCRFVRIRTVAPAHPAAVFIAPLAGMAGSAGVLLPYPTVAVRNIDFAGQAGYADPWHGFILSLTVNQDGIHLPDVNRFNAAGTVITLLVKTHPANHNSTR
jgi:hypothetical protein